MSNQLVVTFQPIMSALILILTILLGLIIVLPLSSCTPTSPGEEEKVDTVKVPIQTQEEYTVTYKLTDLYKYDDWYVIPSPGIAGQWRFKSGMFLDSNMVEYVPYLAFTASHVMHGIHESIDDAYNIWITITWENLLEEAES